MGAIISYWPMDLYAFYIHDRLKLQFRSWTRSKTTLGVDLEAAPLSDPHHSLPQKKQARSLATHLRNNSSLFDHAMAIPLKAVVPMGVLAFCYGFSRVYIILEGWLSMRAQPPSAYQTVDWALFWPHI